MLFQTPSRILIGQIWGFVTPNHYWSLVKLIRKWRFSHSQLPNSTCDSIDWVIIRFGRIKKSRLLGILVWRRYRWDDHFKRRKGNIEMIMMDLLPNKGFSQVHTARLEAKRRSQATPTCRATLPMYFWIWIWMETTSLVGVDVHNNVTLLHRRASVNRARDAREWLPGLEFTSFSKPSNPYYPLSLVRSGLSHQ